MQLSYEQIIGASCEDTLIVCSSLFYLLFYHLKRCIAVCHFTLTKYVVGQTAAENSGVEYCNEYTQMQLSAVLRMQIESPD